MPETITLAAIAKHGTIVLFGAVVHALIAHRKGVSKTLLDFFALTIMSSFSGIIFALIGLHIFGPDQQYITLALAGTGGYLGVEGMSIITSRFIKQIIKK